MLLAAHNQPYSPSVAYKKANKVETATKQDSHAAEPSGSDRLSKRDLKMTPLNGRVGQAACLVARLREGWDVAKPSLLTLRSRSAPPTCARTSSTVYSTR